MATVRCNNPAGRLYLILQEARSKPEGNATKQVWREVLANKNEAADLFIYLSNLYLLVSEVKDKINMTAGDLKEHYLTMFSNIERVVGATNLDADWGSYKQFLTDAVMTELRFCWIELLKTCSEEEVDHDKLMAIYEDIKRLITDALESDIDLTLKQIIVDLLGSIEQSILEYKIRGATSLKKSLERAMGAIQFNYQLFKEKEGNPLVNRLWSIMVNINELTTFALNMPPLLVGTSFALKALTA